ncbi:MAG TPA: hypothetical protein VGC13_18580 [Longimicrobium sp.]|jgi:hypothetical protein|uniref:hypothetical protein n=1 Tax=Longimicrobium sp. TaxID=2029185 RepID=UPI002EDB830A
MSTPFDGSWNRGTGIIGSQADTLTVQMPGRSSAARVAVNAGAPVIYADFTDDAPFTGVLSADGQKILWSNATVWTRDNGNVNGKFADAPAPNAAVVQAVKAAITAANPKLKGVNFGPFNALVVPTAGNFVDIYDGGGQTSLTFYQFQGTAPSGGWLPLGDIVGVPAGNLPLGVMFFAPNSAPGGDPAAFLNPTGFNRLLDDAGSGDHRNVVYWGPIAPAGYVALGICFSNGNTPDTSNYWCIKQEYVLEVSSYTAWNDYHAHWDNNGNLISPCFTASVPETAPPGGILILPPTLLSVQAGGTPYALVGTQATVDVPPIAVPEPVYVDGITDIGDTTACGLRGTLVVVPYTAVPADKVFQQAVVSPFYYVASEPYWQCTMIQPTPLGGMVSVQESVGVSQTDATGFAKTTSMTVGAEFGAAYAGVNVGASVSMTEELRLETSTSTTGSTEVTTTVNLNFPEQEITSVWQSQSQIQVFRSDGTPLGAVAYENGSGNVRFAPSGMTPELLALKAALARG